MCDYQNPRIPEGINVSKEHPLVDFGQMLLVVALSVAAAIVALILLSDQLVRHIPLRYEAKIAEKIDGWLPGLDSRDSLKNHDHRAVEQYLLTLANELRDEVGLPSDMPLTVHYVDSDITNAYATLNGQLVIFRGLLEAVESENGLAFVMAHELGHLRERHPMLALGRGVVVSTALLAVAGVSESAVPDWLINIGGQTTLLSFSRGMELDADELALHAVNAHYGHIGGAEELFDFIADESDVRPPELLSTHPSGERRVARFHTMMADNGWRADGALTPLPNLLKEEKRVVAY